MEEEVEVVGVKEVVVEEMTEVQEAAAMTEDHGDGVMIEDLVEELEMTEVLEVAEAAVVIVTVEMIEVEVEIGAQEEVETGMAEVEDPAVAGEIRVRIVVGAVIAGFLQTTMNLKMQISNLWVILHQTTEEVLDKTIVLIRWVEAEVTPHHY